MSTRRRVHRILCSLLIVGCGNPFPLFAQQPQDRTLTPVANLFVGVVIHLALVVSALILRLVKRGCR